MEPTHLPLPPEIWAATPAAAQALILDQRTRLHELSSQLPKQVFHSPLPPEIWAATPAAAQALILDQSEGLRGLEARLVQFHREQDRGLERFP